MLSNSPEDADLNSSTNSSGQIQVVTDARLVPIEPAALAVNNANNNDWSNSAIDLIDTVPLPWTRGLFYFLLLVVAIVLGTFK